jgi:hypothetical protein
MAGLGEVQPYLPEPCGGQLAGELGGPVASQTVGGEPALRL